jgi:hypothetical protein
LHRFKGLRTPSLELIQRYAKEWVKSPGEATDLEATADELPEAYDELIVQMVMHFDALPREGGDVAYCVLRQIPFRAELDGFLPDIDAVADEELRAERCA